MSAARIDDLAASPCAQFAGVERVEKRPDRETAEERVSKPSLWIDFVAVPAADLRAGRISLRDQFSQDSLRRSFRDADDLRDVPHTGIWVSCDAEQHMRVVGEEHPRAGGLFRRIRFLHSQRFYSSHENNLPGMSRFQTRDSPFMYCRSQIESSRRVPEGES